MMSVSLMIEEVNARYAKYLGLDGPVKPNAIDSL